MLKLELKEGTRVVTSDGREVGKINRFVIDPVTNEVTHIIVQKGWLLSEDRVVPLDKINSATEHDIVLNETMDDYDDLPPFKESQFVQVGEGDVPATTSDDPPQLYVAPAYYWYPPAGYIGFPATGIGYENWPHVQEKENIPEDTIALKEGSNVLSSDEKHVGDVESLIVDPDSKRATHFVISQGLLFKDRKLVPAHWVRTMDEDKVYLAVSSNFLEKLPSYSPD